MYRAHGIRETAALIYVKLEIVGSKTLHIPFLILEDAFTGI